MIETIKIAFVATIFGFIIALPISAMAASNLVPPHISALQERFLQE